MQAHNPLLDTAILDAHQTVAWADILAAGKVVASQVPISDGSVVQDRTQWARRTCSVTFPDYTLMPALATDLLAPYGNEARIWRGIIGPDGSNIMVCQGTYGIQSVSLDYVNGGVKITGIDRGRRVSDARFPFARAFGAASVVGLLQTLLHEASPYSAVQPTPAVVDSTTGPASWETDRDQACITLAASIGCECYAEPYGDFVIAPIPSPYALPVWGVTSTQALVEPTRTLARTGVYNSVVASGTSIPPAVSSLAADGFNPAASDFQPSSPTYINGPFGASTTFYSSPFITSVYGADTAAQGILRDNLGLTRSVSFNTVVHPALEAGDVVSVDFGGGLIEYHLLDRITLPMGPGPMQCSTRTISYQLGS